MLIHNMKIVALKESGIIKRIKLEFTSALLMIDIGLVSFYLGLKVQCDRENQNIKLSQPIYIDKVLSKFQLDKTHTIITSMNKSAIFKQKTDEKIITSDKK